MKFSFVFLIIGVLLIISKLRKFIIVDTIWIILCFALWFLFLYFSIHKKNKDRNMPRPVYLTKQ